MPGFHNRCTGMPGLNSYSMPGVNPCLAGGLVYYKATRETRVSQSVHSTVGLADSGAFQIALQSRADTVTLPDVGPTS